MTETPNDICPICEQEDISYDSAIEPDGDIWRQKCSCPECYSTWDNIYVLIPDGYANIKSDKGKMMTCPNCNMAIDHVEVHSAFDKKAKLLPPEDERQEWIAQISEEDEKVNYEVEIVTCPLCLEPIPFDNIHGETTVKIKRL